MTLIFKLMTLSTSVTQVKTQHSSVGDPVFQLPYLRGEVASLGEMVDDDLVADDHSIDGRIAPNKP